MRGDRTVLYLLSRPQEQCNSMWLSFGVCVRARVLAFRVSVRRPLSLALSEGRGLEKEVSFDFDSRKLVSV